MIIKPKVDNMKRVRSTILLFIVLFSITNLYAQQKIIIRGRVIDSEDKSTVIGANVIEYDKQNRIVNGTITNVSGDFVLTLKDASHTVSIGMIGYKQKTIKVQPGKAIVVELVSESKAIDMVTVTARAKASNSLTNIEDRDKASSSVKVNLSEMKDMGVSSAADALQGKVSGLDIISASGDPGSGSQLVIRGLSSMGNNQPLIVIDGIPQFRVSKDFDLSSASSEDISNLVNIALQDIKSIEVLKDAASTAIYGSRGADGVLLIETRKGKMGRVKFDYQYKTNLNIQPDAIPMLNGDEYIMLQLEELHNSKGIFEIPPEIAYDKDFKDFYNYSANTDWLGELTQNGNTQDHYFSISGGGKKTRYFTSFGYLKETGTTIKTGYQRFSSRINLDFFLSRNLLMQIKFNYTSSLTERNIAVNGRNIREMAYIKAPNMNIWEYDDKGNPTGEYFNPIMSYQGDGVTYFNPVAVANLGRDDSKYNKLENTFMLQYRVKDWITMRETVSFQFGGTKGKNFLPYNAIGADWIGYNINNAGEDNSLDKSIRTETQISFSSPFKSNVHELSGALTWVTDQSGYEWMAISSNKVPSTDIQDPAVAAGIGWIGNGSGDSRMLSGIGNLNYKFRDKYMLQTNFRADAQSSFGKNNRWGKFYGVMLAWRFSNEGFLSSLDWLSESKLRASWGIAGRQPGNVYARFATYESTRTGNYIDDPAIAPKSIQLNNLKWETVSSYDIGLELNLFRDRVYIMSDIYYKVTHDILFNRYPIPYSSGFETLKYLNGGEMTNKGWELMADFKIIRSHSWMWSVNLNASQNINTFTKLPDNFNTERSTSIGNGQYPKRVVEGEPIGSFFGFHYKGVWPSDNDVVARDAQGNIILDSKGIPIPLRYKDMYVFKGGDPIYEDVNHDGQIDLNDVIYLGDSNPDFIGGFGTTLKYKNFYFNVGFYYRLGFDIINGIAIQTEGVNDRNNQSKAVLSRWRTQGQNEPGMTPRAYMDHPANNLGSDRYVEKGDYLRINSLKLSYRVDKKICQKLHIRSADISLSGRKLYTWTKYSGQDPEIGQNAADPFWIGVDYARTPPPKVYTISVGVGF